MKFLKIHAEESNEAFNKIRVLLKDTGWSETHVDEAIRIFFVLQGGEGLDFVSPEIISKTEILREFRYFKYWYFEGAPLSVQIALEVALETGAYLPEAEHVAICASFRDFFEEQLAFKKALNLSETVGGWLFPGEPEKLWEVVKRSKATDYSICEIGTWTGRSTILLASACKHFNKAKRVHVIDDWNFGGQPSLYPYLSDDRRLRTEFEGNTKHLSSQIEIHETTFQDFADRGFVNLPKFDVVFHDAGHTGKDFERDLPLLERVFAPSATLLIHDYVSRNFAEARPIVDAWIAASDCRSLEGTVGTTAIIRIGDFDVA